MIYYGAQEQIASNPRSEFLEHHAALAAIYGDPGAGAGTPPFEIYFTEPQFEVYTPQPRNEMIREEFDWTNAKLCREYVRLEQKVLAKVANADEARRYNVMKRDRNSKVFADRFLHDYQEMRRLQELSKRISELQQYLQPIPT